MYLRQFHDLIKKYIYLFITCQWPILSVWILIFFHESEFVYLYLSYKNVNKVTKPLQNWYIRIGCWHVMNNMKRLWKVLAKSHDCGLKGPQDFISGRTYFRGYYTWNYYLHTCDDLFFIKRHYFPRSNTYYWQICW